MLEETVNPEVTANAVMRKSRAELSALAGSHSLWGTCRSGGETGRREGLKIPWAKAHAGSIPAPSTQVADVETLSYVDSLDGDSEAGLMAKNAAQQKKNDNGATTQPAPESIDQVRDLLFGGQMRMVDARIQSLDERLAHETSAMRADFERQITELDSAIKKELGRHSERLVAERTKTVEDLKALSGEMRESLRSLEKRHTTLEEAAGLADAELRDHLLKQGASFASDLARTNEKLSSELDRITTRLQAEKLDSSALAAGLVDLAGKLGGSSAAVQPVKKPARN